MPVSAPAALHSELVALRRTLHAHPEAGFALPRTQRSVLTAMAPLDLEVTPGPHDFTSIVAVLHGARPGPSVLLRADMDALRVTEETKLPFASQTPGLMHACGHDLHTAALVGTAKLLSARRDEIAGSVVFMFEPGEEAGGGAQRLIDEGILSGVEAAYGIHVLPGPAGVFTTRAGSVMAGASSLTVRVLGRSGHGSRPHQAVDPVPAAAQIISALHTYVTRRFPVFDPVVLSVTKMQASDIINAIPDEATLAATIRALSAESVDILARELPSLADGIASAFGCRAETEFRSVYPVTANDPETAAHALTVLGDLFGPERAVPLEHPIMASESFSAVLKEVPGAFVFLGTTPEGIDPDTAEMNHSPRAVFDDSVLSDQAAALAALALSHVSRP
ncbi:M20 family metallopeptidase [Amycolatopsis sp. FU40]|uniref:M20 metallopeptidase family protein n=1 Tax=Amycolatopsis sp. FU40 TaxID=2914159 RepID=UPI001F30DD1B|nr:M20 family metallopeptidase [Amycolatopsis sp. FU40]UKD51273.1 M20 family metallopeptidase [Amycolatopsis sp. FU40]